MSKNQKRKSKPGKNDTDDVLKSKERAFVLFLRAYGAPFTTISADFRGLREKQS